MRTNMGHDSHHKELMLVAIVDGMDVSMGHLEMLSFLSFTSVLGRDVSRAQLATLMISSIVYSFGMVVNNGRDSQESVLRRFHFGESVSIWSHSEHFKVVSRLSCSGIAEIRGQSEQSKFSKDGRVGNCVRRKQPRDSSV
jgi:chromosome condensin MukBEF MukE localization factor